MNPPAPCRRCSSATPGPKIVGAPSGNTVIWRALSAAALLCAVVAYFVGDGLLKMNSVINAGANARNSTFSLNTVPDQSHGSTALVPFPVAYAVSTVRALIGGYDSRLRRADYFVMEVQT